MFPPAGPVVQLVRTLACHARGQGFESPSGRQKVAKRLDGSRPIFLKHASVAQLVEQGTENPRVVGSTPTGGTICGRSSSGRARPCQGRGGGFEPRNPLHTAPWPSGKAQVCKTSIPQFKSGWRLQTEEHCESSALLFGNEAHLRCMKNEARPSLMKRGFATRRA